MQDWRLEWDRGSLRVLADGGMLCDVSLDIGGGHSCAPFYEAPWLDEGMSLDPKLLENLRSEFPCVPFGGIYPPDSVTDDWKPALAFEPSPEDGALDATDELLHGPGCLGQWTLVERSANHMTIALDYPQSSPVSRLRSHRALHARRGSHRFFAGDHRAAACTAAHRSPPQPRVSCHRGRPARDPRRLRVRRHPSGRARGRRVTRIAGRYVHRSGACTAGGLGAMARSIVCPSRTTPRKSSSFAEPTALCASKTRAPGPPIA